MDILCCLCCYASVSADKGTLCLYMSVCSSFLLPPPAGFRLSFRAMKRTSEDMLEFDVNDSSQRPITPKKNAPGEREVTVWVENLPPQCNCIRASFTLDSQGIIDDLKTQIVARFANPRWGLYKRHFRVSQNSVHKPFYEKLSSLDPDLPVRFEWTEYTGEHRPPLEYRP